MFKLVYPNVFSPLYVIYKNPSSSLYNSYKYFSEYDVGGNTLLINKNIALFSLRFNRLRITYINCPAVKSFGTRYLCLSKSGIVFVLDVVF